MKSWAIMLVWCCLSVMGCDTDEAEFPELIAGNAQQLGTTSVVLEAEIKETGSVRPIRYGFLWSTSAGIQIFNAPNKLDLGETSEKRKYSVRLESLVSGTQYFVRAFAANQDYSKIYYSNEITFTTLN